MLKSQISETSNGIQLQFHKPLIITLTNRTTENRKDQHFIHRLQAQKLALRPLW